mgnify:CR=1 FL=1|jgi:hypothetical protein
MYSDLVSIMQLWKRTCAVRFVSSHSIRQCVEGCKSFWVNGRVRVCCNSGNVLWTEEGRAEMEHVCTMTSVNDLCRFAAKIENRYVCRASGNAVDMDFMVPGSEVYSNYTHAYSQMMRKANRRQARVDSLGKLQRRIVGAAREVIELLLADELENLNEIANAACSALEQIRGPVDKFECFVAAFLKVCSIPTADSVACRFPQLRFLYRADDHTAVLSSKGWAKLLNASQRDITACERLIRNNVLVFKFSTEAFIVTEMMSARYKRFGLRVR